MAIALSATTDFTRTFGGQPGCLLAGEGFEGCLQYAGMLTGKGGGPAEVIEFDRFLGLLGVLCTHGIRNARAETGREESVMDPMCAEKLPALPGEPKGGLTTFGSAKGAPGAASSSLTA